MNRRAFLLGFAAVSAAIPFARYFSTDVFAQSGRTVSRIVVDTGPLEARGARGAAAVIGQQLRASLAREFAGRIGSGPVLTARIHGVLLAHYSGGNEDFGGIPSDYLEGEIIVGKQRIPLDVAVSADSGGTWYVPGFEERRLRALADSFASWARRRV
ncbi:MAG TPA: hypothetical protein VFY21_13055 [Xanthobacteraceae bacterium]|nr:hypothetical protein [Xanthobacteraceae bacterium]